VLVEANTSLSSHSQVVNFLNKVFATAGADDPESSQNDLENVEVALKTHFDTPKIMFSSLKTSCTLTHC
jgi:hypothetical protein